jgi:hypothetical protein
MEKKYLMNVAEDQEQPFTKAAYLRLDNSNLTAQKAAAKIMEHFKL